jgi:hypothetical protein
MSRDADDQVDVGRNLVEVGGETPLEIGVGAIVHGDAPVADRPRSAISASAKRA